MKLSMIKIVAVTAALIGGSVANAAPVTSWNYWTDLNFTGTPTFDGSGGDQYDDDHEISWGYDRNSANLDDTDTSSSVSRSGLTIGGNLLPFDSQGDPQVPGSPTGGGAVTGVVDTDFDFSLDAGEAGYGNSLTHWNNTISSSFGTLDSASLLDELKLSAATPYVGSQKPVPSIVFDFKFEETPNAGVWDSDDQRYECADGEQRPSEGCEDIWGYFGVQSTGIPFQYNGHLYAASVLVIDPTNPTGSTPIDFLTDGECAALELDSGCQGFITREARTTPVQFGFMVSYLQEVPVPAAVWLFGTALIGFAGYSRRKAKKS